MPTVQAPEILSPSRQGWPPEVELILSALEAAAVPHDNRRRHPRMSYRVAAELRLYSDAPATPAWRLYTRDISVRGMGFITAHRLPLGYGGVVQIAAPHSGRIVSVAGTLFRCRQVTGGWSEGSLYFNREQWIFSPDNEDEDVNA